MDSSSAPIAGIGAPALDAASDGRPGLSGLSEIDLLSENDLDEFWRESQAESVSLERDEFAAMLIAIGFRHNYGLPAGTHPGQAQVAAFCRALQLQDLALAHACALGRDAAWRRFMTRFREPLTQAAIGITGATESGRELADSLYAEMYGLRERDGQRQSPLASYSGRGSLKGFLRATLAQRHVDCHRRTWRETELTPGDLPALLPPPTATPDVLASLQNAVTDALGALAAEERFLLSAWFLDRRTLLEISRIMGVHEATASRRVQRLTANLHKDLRARLQASGMSRAAADEALGTDPRDLDINLRGLLQNSQSTTFLEERAATGSDQT